MYVYIAKKLPCIKIFKYNNNPFITGSVVKRFFLDESLKKVLNSELCAEQSTTKMGARGLALHR
jgi:hypothetical protein